MSIPKDKNAVGRPSTPSHNRERLIDAARHCFVQQEYSKVSIRNIAKGAGVDAGLIRYYFGSKDKLFSAMLNETTQPIFQEFKQLKKADNFDGLTGVMHRYYQVMQKYPDFPLLVFRLASLPEDNSEHQLIKSNIFRKIESDISSYISGQDFLRDGVNPGLALFSIMSMTVFPFIMPPMIREQHGIGLDEASLERLFQHNVSLLKHGMMRKPEHD